MNTLWYDIQLNLPFLVLVGTAMVVLLAESRRSSLPVVSAVLSSIGLLFTLLLSLMSAPERRETFYGMIFTGSLVNILLCSISVVALVSLAASVWYFPKFGYKRGEFYSLLLFAVQGMVLLVAANDVLILFLGVELLSISLYALSGLFRFSERSIEAALKYFLLGAFATGFLLFGIALLYGASGTTSITKLQHIAVSLMQKPLFVAGSALLLIGLLFKIAAVPFHMWAPDVYEGAPTPVTGFMAGGVKVAGFAILSSLVLKIFAPSTNITTAIALVSAASMIVGNVFALVQRNIKRMMAYSSIAHVGYILSGVAAATVEGTIGTIFYAIVYAIMTVGVFSIIGWMEQKEPGAVMLENFEGLSSQQPFLAALMALFLFAFAGVPPFAGFMGKYYVFFSAVSANLLWLAIVGVLTSVLSAYYYLRIVVLMYFHPASVEASGKLPILLVLSILFCALATVLLGVLPSPFIEMLAKAL